MIDLSVLITFLAGFVGGYVYRETKMIKDLVVMKHNLEREIKEQLPEGAQQVRDVLKLKLEQHSDIFYFFDEKTDTFVAQGGDLTAAARHFFSLRGPDILGHFTFTDNKDYCFVNGEVLKYQNERI